MIFQKYSSIINAQILIVNYHFLQISLVYLFKGDFYSIIDTHIKEIIMPI